jgi:hypothetical protein
MYSNFHTDGNRIFPACNINDLRTVRRPEIDSSRKNNSAGADNVFYGDQKQALRQGACPCDNPNRSGRRQALP